MYVVDGVCRALCTINGIADRTSTNFLVTPRNFLRNFCLSSHHRFFEIKLSRKSGRGQRPRLRARSQLSSPPSRTHICPRLIQRSQISSQSPLPRLRTHAHTPTPKGALATIQSPVSHAHMPTPKGALATPSSPPSRTHTSPDQQTIPSSKVHSTYSKYQGGGWTNNCCSSEAWRWSPSVCWNPRTHSCPRR